MQPSSDSPVILTLPCSYAFETQGPKSVLIPNCYVEPNILMGDHPAANRVQDIWIPLASFRHVQEVRRIGTVLT
jgi:hypothetical protein